MQRKFVHSLNGQEIESDDINLIATDASAADDKVFSELFRLTPYNGSSVNKQLLPYTAGPTVQVNGASGSVKVFPFRALIGSNTLVATDPSLNWNDIRTQVFVGSGTTLYQTVTFANNSTNPRWDLVYARVDRDITDTSAIRYVKTAGPPVAETPTTIVTVVNTTVTLGVVTGTPSGSAPALPALPADGGGAYYIPIAYVQIPNPFGPTTTVLTNQILDVAPIVKQPTLAVSVSSPANSLNVPTGAMMSKAVGGVSDWGLSDSRPPSFLPPSMIGEYTVFVALDLTNNSSSLWSHPDGSILDSSIDWRNRILRWQAHASGSSGKFAWDTTATDTIVVPNGIGPFGGMNSTSANCASGMGQSFVSNTSTVGANKSTAAYFDNQVVGAAIASPKKVYIYVDQTDGTLRFTTASTVPNCIIVMSLTASAQFPNH